jgi:hypothetical protein
MACVVAAWAVWFAHLTKAHAGPVTQVFEALNETVNLTEWQYQQESGGAVVDDSGIVAHSIGRALIATATSTAGQRQAFANKHVSGGVHNHVRFYINPYTLNSTGGASAIRNVVAVYTRGLVDQRLALRVEDLGTTFALSSLTRDDDFTGNAVVLDTIDASWHRVDLYEYSAAEPNGIMRVYVDGVLRHQADTLDTDGSKWDSLRVGFGTLASTTNSGWLAFDDVVFDTMPCPPPCGIEPVRAEYGFPSSDFGGF